MTISAANDNALCMIGTIRTKEKCPRCGEKFAESRKGLQCAECKTTPRKYFLDIPQLSPNRKLYRDSTGHVFDSYARADQELSTIRAEMRKGTFDIRNYVQKEIRLLQFENYAEVWLSRRELEQKRGQISQGYFEVMRGWLQKYIIPFFGKKNIREIREGMIDDFRNSLPETLRGKTVHNIMALLHKIFRDACHKRHDIERVPDFPKVEVDDVEIKFVTPEEQDSILSQVTDPIFRALFTFLRYQACRPGEARALRWERVDLKAGRVVLDAAMDREHYRGRTKERNILKRPLHPEALAALRSLPRDISGFVFTYKGRPITKSRAWAVWTQAAQKAGISITLYAGTRHSFAMDALNGGVDKDLIGDFLGHKDSRSIKRYAKFQTDTFKQVWERPCPQSVPKAQNDMG